MMQDDRFSVSESKAFLENFFSKHKGFIRILLIHSTEKVSNSESGNEQALTMSQFFESVDNIRFSDLKESNKEGFNIYYGVLTGKEESGDKFSCLEMPGISVDIDAKDFESKHGAWEHIFRTIARTGLEPTFIIDSGNGYHLYFLFSKFEVVESKVDIPRFEGYVNGVGELFGGDYTHNLNRVMRLPGFDNLKDPSNPKPCKIVSSNPGLRYNLSDFENYRVEVKESHMNNDLEIKDTPTEIPKRFFDLLEQDTKLRETWEGKRKDLNDKSGSGMDMALGDALIRNGFTDAEIAKILTEAPYPKENQRTEDYLKHTISKAKQFMDDGCAEKRQEELSTTVERMIKQRKPRTDILGEISKLKFATEREDWLRKLKDSTGSTLEALREDLAKITNNRRVDKVGAEKPSQPQDPLGEYTEEEITKARDILTSSDILGGIIRVTEKAGYVGEVRNKKLTYLALTSRKLLGGKKAISLTPKGESSSGKSDLIKTALRLIPADEWKEYTYITEKALLHTKMDLSHKILCIFEREGGRQADYTIRTAQSEEKLKILVTRKNPDTGEFETAEKEIPAEGMVYIETTTEEHIEQQNANRTFEFFTDSSPELTREVLMAQAKNQNLDEDCLEQDCRIWRCAQVLLQPLRVYIPFAEELAKQFPVDKVRARRDFPRLLALIETSALLYQEQRERKELKGKTVVVASVDDFHTAYEITGPIILQVYKELSPKEEALTQIIKDEYSFGKFGDPIECPDISAFGVQELLEKMKKRYQNKKEDEARYFIRYNTLRKYLKKLVGRGILEWNEGKATKSKYILVNDTPQIPFQLSLDS